jgi:hypothetical protein
MKTQYWNPDKNAWVDKLPKKFIDKLVKTRQVPTETIQPVTVTKEQ